MGIGGDGMTRKKNYWETIAEHIAEVVGAQQIENVLHFSRLENLPGILEHGLLSRSVLRNADYGVYVSDAGRLDKEDDAISVSISCYYPKMFEAKRHRSGDEPWVILVLHPSLLWNYPCRFHRNGAATNATKYGSSTTYGGFALKTLFDDFSLSTDSTKTSFRAEYGLPISWPTFSDSEVQVMSPIHPDYVMGAWIETPEHDEFVQAAFATKGRKECKVVVQPFSPRICRKPYCWG